jgi:hypothetical protein
MPPRSLSLSEEFSLLLVERGVKEMSRSELERAVVDLYEAYLRLCYIQVGSDTQSG